MGWLLGGVPGATQLEPPWTTRHGLLHSLHWLREPCAYEEYRPGGHTVHEFELKELENLPSGHSSHVAKPERNSPGRQPLPCTASTHVRRSAELYCPPGHTLQLNCEGMARCRYVPPAHLAHARFGVMKRPAGHVAQ